MTTTTTQKQAILSHLQKGKEITPLQALEWFGCFRLASRINDLKKDGHGIQTEMFTNQFGKRFAKYKLVKK